MKVSENDAGHMTKMATMPIYGINPLKSSLQEPVTILRHGQILQLKLLYEKM